MIEQANSYLNEVMNQQAQVERDLQPRHQPAPPAPVQIATRGIGRELAKGIVEFKKGMKGIEDEAPRDAGGAAGIVPSDYRITGFGFWKTVVVAPNVYVVHTRRGHAEPINIGLGLSFHYRPATDAFLIIPAAVQTLLINARCICAERQGVLVQAYVQWVVDDVKTAYRRLDFSDPGDRMRIVKVQLREQAEAAIKDKVATMSIDAILNDKQPIIAELTHRLRAVAEGDEAADRSTGLGLKIVTVQIKEAVVSSTRVWENLQKPFRADREKLARLAELEAQQQIAAQELHNRQTREIAELEVERRLADVRSQQERERFDREESEKVRRFDIEQQTARRALVEQTATEKTRREAELERALHELDVQGRRVQQELQSLRQQAELEQLRAELERSRTAARLQTETLVHEATAARHERDLGVEKQRRALDNDLSSAHLQAQLIARLPEIAATLPKPDELRSVHIGGDGAPGDGLAGFLASVLALADQFGARRSEANGTTAPASAQE
ncbi:MAG: hypothetical protein JNM56_13400 [Planctomycetia bacterium]|nr:hypothetical protein [Planctomycetia bacterium]